MKDRSATLRTDWLAATWVAVFLCALVAVRADDARAQDARADDARAQGARLEDASPRESEITDADVAGETRAADVVAARRESLRALTHARATHAFAEGALAAGAFLRTYGFAHPSPPTLDSLADSLAEAAAESSAASPTASPALEAVPPIFLYEFASLLHRAGRLGHALAFYERALAADPNPPAPQVLNDLGALHLARGEFASARSRLDTAAATSDADTNSHAHAILEAEIEHNLALLEETEGDLQAASLRLEAALARLALPAANGLATDASATNESREARLLAAARLRNAHARVLLALGEEPRALRLWNQTLRAETGAGSLARAEAYEALARRAEVRGSLGDATLALDRALELRRFATPPSSDTALARALAQRGAVRFRARDHSGARLDYRAAAALLIRGNRGVDAESAALSYNLAVANLADGRAPEAEAAADAALAALASVAGGTPAGASKEGASKEEDIALPRRAPEVVPPALSALALGEARALLVRGEARALQGRTSEAEADFVAARTRAGGTRFAVAAASAAASGVESGTPACTINATINTEATAEAAQAALRLARLRQRAGRTSEALADAAEAEAMHRCLFGRRSAEYAAAAASLGSLWPTP